MIPQETIAHYQILTTIRNNGAQPGGIHVGNATAGLLKVSHWRSS